MRQGDEALQHHPLPYKTICQGQCGKAHSADKGKDCSVRHLASQATKKFKVLATGSVHNAACTHKHQHFHDGMIESV